MSRLDSNIRLFRQFIAAEARAFTLQGRERVADGTMIELLQIHIIVLRSRQDWIHGLRSHWLLIAVVPMTRRGATDFLNEFDSLFKRLLDDVSVLIAVGIAAGDKVQTCSVIIKKVRPFLREASLLVLIFQQEMDLFPLPECHLFPSSEKVMDKQPCAERIKQHVYLRHHRSKEQEGDRMA